MGLMVSTPLWVPLAVAVVGVLGTLSAAVFTQSWAAKRENQRRDYEQAAEKLPETEWGLLTFGDSSPAAGKDFTDDGAVHEDRGLKGRPRRAVRKVPIPPELVALLRAHLARFGAAADGRLFRSVNGGTIQPSTYWQVWRKVRALSLTHDQRATPLMRRPYDLRHAGVTWRLNCGIPAPEVAKWAGHSVEVLTRIYAKCVEGLDDVWINRMDESLRRDVDDGTERPAS
jgi:hypothetical protein